LRRRPSFTLAPAFTVEWASYRMGRGRATLEGSHWEARTRFMLPGHPVEIPRGFRTGFFAVLEREIA